MKGINLEEIKKTINVLKPNGALYEIRILAGKQIISGYFKGTDNLEAAFKTISIQDANVFYTLNTINEDCYARKQHECFRMEKLTTSDSDIVAYEWLLIDIDPKRSSGVSSSDEEFEYAKAKARNVYQFMKERGFEEPIIAMSGNGMHLMYSVQMKKTDENKELIENCLKALDLLFSDDKVDIDTSVFNPARISKLYGTMAQKGANTEKRPHRMSHIVKVPNEIKQNEKRLLQALANELPKEEPKPKRKKDEFDIDGWLLKNGIGVDSIKNWKGGIKYVLTECPFDSSHKAPDSTIIKMDSGAICFKCLHNSCAGRDWRELRLKYEPDAYDEKDSDYDRINAGWKEHQKFNRNRSDVEYKELETVTEDEPMWETVGSILEKPKEERVCIPTGIDVLDKKIVGLAKGEISVVSGLRAASKSTLLSQITLNAIDMGYNVLMYSGELKDTRLVEWMLCQAAGRENITKSVKYPTAWAKAEVKPLIAEWIGNKLRIYNNRYGNDFTRIATELANGIKESQADLVIIDNMAILNLSNIKPGADKYEQQTLFVEMLKNISIQCNCHVIFVAHPRKANGFLRLDDISGSGNIGNLVDNAFIVHRNNEDFHRLTKEMFKWKEDDPRYSGTNCVEICKDREYGNQDVFIPLWYEQYTRRMLNYENEYKCYGWDKSDAFLMAADDDDIPF